MRNNTLTNEEKELLLKALCAYLPYHLKCKIGGLDDCTLQGEDIDDFIFAKHKDIKPFLRPMSSMTEEEKVEYNQLCYNCQEQDSVDYNITELDRTQLLYVIDWLNSHHFDFRGLIEKGLALEAPEGMYDITQLSTTASNVKTL